MARDHAQISLYMWADDDWRRLSVPAQHLYMVLLTSPTLSFCGVADWRPARLARLAGNCKVSDVQAAADELVSHLYLVIDVETEEVLVRSFVRHDGLMKQPNMATAMATAHTGIASPLLRGVVVHELRRLKDEQPDLAGWRSERALEVLTREAIDPSVDPSRNPSVNPSAKGSNDPNPMGSVDPSVDPCPTPAPTPTPAPSTSKEVEKETTAPRKRGRRIPDDFVVTDEMREWADKGGFGHIDLERVTVEFCDYWASESGSKAVKADWVGTWRNRVRAVAERAPSNVRQLRGDGDRTGKTKWIEVAPDQWQEAHPEGVYYGKRVEWR